MSASEWRDRIEAARGQWVSTMIGQWVVVRDHMAGVYCGRLLWIDGQSWGLEEARQAHYWTGAAATPGLAVRGPGGGRIGPPSRIEGHQLVSVMACTPEAVAAWQRQPEWAP